MEERVQKILARAGYGSRRASEELIIAGRVRINGQLAVLGSKADPQRDTITIDNQPIAREQAPVYIALNKPTGILSEVSPEEPRETVRDLVPVPGHMFIVGRLDLESEGLILLTNDGEMANKLTHPRYGHEKEYRVLVGARPDERQMDAWRHGVVLEDGYRTAPAQIRIETVQGKGAWLRVILHEGRKRQIREMGRLTGLPVLRIQRIRIGSLLIGELKPGQWRELRPDEVRALKVNKSYRDPERPARREGRREVSRGDTPRGSVARGYSASRGGPGGSGSRGGSTRTGSTRTGSTRADSTRTGSTRTGGTRTGGSRTGGPRAEGSREGGPRERTPRREGAYQRDDSQGRGSAGPRREGDTSERRERPASSGAPDREGGRRSPRPPAKPRSGPGSTSTRSPRPPRRDSDKTHK